MDKLCFQLSSLRDAVVTLIRLTHKKCNVLDYQTGIRLHQFKFKSFELNKYVAKDSLLVEQADRLTMESVRALVQQILRKGVDEYVSMEHNNPENTWNIELPDGDLITIPDMAYECAVFGPVVKRKQDYWKVTVILVNFIFFFDIILV